MESPLRDLVEVDPIPASQPFPDEIVAAIEMEAEAAATAPGRAGYRDEIAEMPQFEAGTTDELGGFRPEWVAREPLPRLVPFRPHGRRIAGRERALPGPAYELLLLAPPTMQTLEAQLVPSCEWPWRTVGKVLSGNMPNFDNARHSGTGVLVGPNLLLTASHLHCWDHPPEGWWMRFVPAYVEGLEPYGRSFVSDVHGYQTDGHPGGLDYVICKLYEPLGNRTGWMGSKSFGSDADYENRRWTSVGYPDVFMGGQDAAVDYNIEIVDIDNDGNDSRELEVDYNVAFGGGWSGGPLWGWFDGDAKVIGIKSGYEADGWDPVRGVFAGGRPMVDLVKFGWAHWQ
jgi:hypothetical protein